jgi:energy-coupling factor transporter ATP-binding protein EcfA2
MSDARAKFRELTRVFDPIYQPRQGASDGPGESYVPETHETYRAHLNAALDLNDNVKLLVAGQPGCGKTTLLRSLTSELRRQGRLVAFVDLEVDVSIQDLDLVEMYLAGLAELLAQVAPCGAKLGDATLEQCRRWLADSFTDAGIKPGVPDAVDALKGLLRQIAGSVAQREEIRALMRPGTEHDPLPVLRRVLEDLADMRPVLILDGLDKLPPANAEKTFLTDKPKPMVELPGVAILTIPLSVVYEPTFNVLSERYNNADSAVLPAVRLWNFNPATRERTASQAGIGILRRIVSARVDPIDPDIVMPDAIERAIVGSGGNIRELARLMQSSVVKAYARGGEFVELRDIEAAIADLRESYRRAYNAEFREILERVRAEFRLDDSSRIAKQLLYGLWIIEYRNGSAWYSLPEPVEQLLRQMERVKE